jgi:tyrosyl-tRNA synthetase
MSKSDPDSAIFMEDSEKDVERKIKKAYCPEKVVENNPIIDYLRHILLPAFDYKFEISLRQGESKVTKIYSDYSQVETDYLSGELHPSDLKPAVIEGINKLLRPVREHFE